VRTGVTSEPGREPAPGTAIWVRAVGPHGELLGRWVLEHGRSVPHLLWSAGLVPLSVQGVAGRLAAEEVEVTVLVRHRQETDAPLLTRTPLLDADLLPEQAVGAVRVQRLAAYALVVGVRGVLLTQLSGRTHSVGRWGLPGGGVEPGETPQEAVRREVREETGQVIRLGRVHSVSDGHWIGRAPDGRVEDFHAVRLVWRAVCDEPSEPVVHDLDGTTAAAAWVPPARVGDRPASDAWAALLRAEFPPAGSAPA